MEHRNGTLGTRNTRIVGNRHNMVVKESCSSTVISRSLGFDWHDSENSGSTGRERIHNDNDNMVVIMRIYFQQQETLFRWQTENKDKIILYQSKDNQSILHHIHNFETQTTQCLDHSEQQNAQRFDRGGPKWLHQHNTEHNRSHSWSSNTIKYTGRQSLTKHTCRRLRTKSHVRVIRLLGKNYIQTKANF
jgi:hypothetical protein